MESERRDLTALVSAVPQPDPNQPKPEGRQIVPVKGEPLGVGSNWPPSLEAALQRWGTTQAKCPCLTALDVTGKTLYTLTYGEFLLSFYKLIYTADPFWDGTGDHTIDCVLCCWFYWQAGSFIFFACVFLVRQALESKSEAGLHSTEQTGDQE